MAKKIISASIEATTVRNVLKLAKSDNRSFSAMADILLNEAMVARKKMKNTK